MTLESSVTTLGPLVSPIFPLLPIRARVIDPHRLNDNWASTAAAGRSSENVFVGFFGLRLPLNVNICVAGVGGAEELVAVGEGEDVVVGSLEGGDVDGLALGGSEAEGDGLDDGPWLGPGTGAPSASIA